MEMPGYLSDSRALLFWEGYLENLNAHEIY
jgi:hypothetical protein